VLVGAALATDAFDVLQDDDFGHGGSFTWAYKP
jgi:hypothetical protein